MLTLMRQSKTHHQSETFFFFFRPPIKECLRRMLILKGQCKTHHQSESPSPHRKHQQQNLHGVQFRLAWMQHAQQTKKATFKAKQKQNNTHTQINKFLMQTSFHRTSSGVYSPLCSAAAVDSERMAAPTKTPCCQLNDS